MLRTAGMVLQPTLKFSKVGLLIHVLYKMTRAVTFQKFNQSRYSVHRTNIAAADAEIPQRQLTGKRNI